MIMDYELWMLDEIHSADVLQYAKGSFVTRLRLTPQDEQ
jgi:hypothetical protein